MPSPECHFGGDVFPPITHRRICRILLYAFTYFFPVHIFPQPFAVPSFAHSLGSYSMHRPRDSDPTALSCPFPRKRQSALRGGSWAAALCSPGMHKPSILTGLEFAKLIYPICFGVFFIYFFAGGGLRSQLPVFFFVPPGICHPREVVGGEGVVRVYSRTEVFTSRICPCATEVFR